MKKRLALIPSEREKECEHERLHYRGAIPCTGPKVCDMCGLREDEILLHRKVAKLFCARVKEEIGAENLSKAVALNRTEKDANVCHTHDFCDTNMVMEAACDEAGIPGWADGEDGVRTAIWNEAWTLAKSAEFDEKRVP